MEVRELFSEGLEGGLESFVDYLGDEHNRCMRLKGRCGERGFLLSTSFRRPEI
jgi:hypothetical protein